MRQQRAGRYLLFELLALVIGLVISGLALRSGRPANAQQGRDVRDAVDQTTQGDTKQAGAYFFYWWLLPDDPDGVDPYTWMAFQPPAVVEQDTCFHDPDPGPCISYTGGTYNNVYYDVDSQRWWEWQFRDMAEAGLNIAFMNSWDVVSMADVSNPYSGWTNDQKTITYVRDALRSALDTIGNPIKIGLFDDTRAEHYQWCLDNGYPMPDCDTNLQQYPMSLIGFTLDKPNKDYFWYKWRYFYEAIPQDKWATHNGLPVDQGGRPLILMWHGWFFIDFAASSGTMCYLKEQFYNWTQQVYGQGVEPFLLPDFRWREPGDSDLTLDSMCTITHTNWHAIDGWSYFGMATSGEGGRVFRNDRNSYTTAYVGAGADHCLQWSLWPGRQSPEVLADRIVSPLVGRPRRWGSVLLSGRREAG